MASSKRTARGWQVLGTRQSDYHILPVDDLREHEGQRSCWCQPRLERVDEVPATIVVHNSMDGRELVEQHGVN